MPTIQRTRLLLLETLSPSILKLTAWVAAQVFIYSTIWKDILIATLRLHHQPTKEKRKVETFKRPPLVSITMLWYISRLFLNEWSKDSYYFRSCRISNSCILKLLKSFFKLKLDTYAERGSLSNCDKFL